MGKNIKRSAIEEVLLALPDLPETVAMKENLLRTNNPKKRTEIIEKFLDKHGDKDFVQFLTRNKS